MPAGSAPSISKISRRPIQRPRALAPGQTQEVDRVGAGGLSNTEGIATKIDRGKKEITIRYDDGKIEKLKLTDRAAADVGRSIDENTRIVVYFSSEGGAKVTHYFKKRQG